MPTKHLIKPKYFAPLKPNEDLSKTINGNQNFWEGLPIKFEKKNTNNDPKIVPNKTTNVFKL